MSVASEIVDCLRTEMSRLPSDKQPGLAALIGSYARGTPRSDSDIDVLIVGQSDLANYDTYNCIQQATYGLQRLAVFRDVALVCAPALAIHDHCTSIAERALSREVILVHLLMYPSIRYIKEWEHPMVVRGFHADLQYRHIAVGNHSMLRSIVKQRVGGVDVQKHLLHTFLSGYMYYMELKRIDIDFALRYAVNHLHYCARHLAELEGGEARPDPVISDPAERQLLRDLRAIEELKCGRELKLPGRIDGLYKACWSNFVGTMPASP